MTNITPCMQEGTSTASVLAWQDRALDLLMPMQSRPARKRAFKAGPTAPPRSGSRRGIHRIRNPFRVLASQG